MCLAVPSKIIEIEDNMAVIDVDGIKRKTSLMLLENPQVGDYVIVHAGFALHKIDESVAMDTLQILRDAAELAEKSEDMEQ